MLYKIAALGFVLIYFGLLIGCRSYLLYRRTGINPLRPAVQAGARGLNERILGLATLVLPVVALNYAFLEDNYRYLAPIPYLEGALYKNVGLALSAIGLLWTFVAQLQMKDSWRIGIEPTSKTPLITGGLYRYSRNPIYLGLIGAFLGFFLLAPNALSLCFLAIMYSSIALKVRFEEEFLRQTHGTQFLQYASQVRRWL